MREVLLLGQTGPIGKEFLNRLSDHEVFSALDPEFNWREADRESRRQTLLAASAVVLATPRSVSREIVAKIEALNPDLLIYDCSGMHKGEPSWIYSLPELSPDLNNGSKRLIGPGCFATAASLALWPIKERIDTQRDLFIEAIAGASTGGKKWVRFFNENPNQDIYVPNSGLNHPHIAEIQRNLDLPELPVRMVPQLTRRYRGTSMAIHGTLNDAGTLNYSELIPGWEKLVFQNNTPQWGAVIGTDEVHVSWVQEAERFSIHLAYDNLGKGSVGQALQSLEIALGV